MFESSPTIVLNLQAQMELAFDVLFSTLLAWPSLAGMLNNQPEVRSPPVSARGGLMATTAQLVQCCLLDQDLILQSPVWMAIYLFIASVLRHDSALGKNWYSHN